MTLYIQSTSAGVVIAVKVVPNSSRDQLAGLLGEALKIKVAAPPEAGKANKAVCRLIADHLGIVPSAVSVISGQTQAHKRIAIAGLDQASVRERLA